MILKKMMYGAGAALYLFLVGLGFWFLYSSRTGQALESPWQTIDPRYIYVFFAATLVLGLSIWLIEKKFLSYLLVFLVLHSFLFHSYLPLTHELFYGADQWRHMANEARLLDGESFLKPMLSTSNQSTFQKLDVGLISYAQLWGLTGLVAKVFSIDLLTINIWLVPIIWSVAFPLLLYAVGRSFGWEKRKSLGLVLLSFLPFTWAAGGSLTLPNSLGFLWFLALFSFLLKRLQNASSRKFLIILCVGLAVSLVGYLVYVVVFIIMWALAEMLIRTQEFSVIKKKITYICSIFFGALLIPLGELVAKYSSFSLHHQWFAEVKQMIGNFTAVYLAAGPRPHDIDRGNIIFNQTPFVAFVPNFFTSNRWWLVFFMVLFLGAVVCGVVRGYKNRQNLLYVYNALATTIFTGSYVVGRYVLEGQQILSRRLEHMVALFWIISFLIGCEWLYSLLNKQSAVFKKIGVVVGIIIFASAISASYTLGPDIHALSTDEYKATQYIWDQEKNNTQYCVVGDTYPLLALEAVSHKRIIGGGFPIDQYFGQPEKETLFKELKTNAREEFWQKALGITKTNNCWLIVNKREFKSNAFFNQYNNDTIMFGEVLVWKFNAQTINLN